MHRTRPRSSRPIGRDIHARLGFVDDVRVRSEPSRISRRTADVFQLEYDLDDLRDRLFGAVRQFWRKYREYYFVSRTDGGMCLLCDSGTAMEAAPVEIVRVLVAGGIDLHRIGELVGLSVCADISISTKNSLFVANKTRLTLR